MGEEQEAYGDGTSYWDQRYLEKPKPSDWILKYEGLRDILDRLMNGNRELKILHVGCGNSLLTEAMYDDGYKHVVNIDNSPVAIELMRARNAELRPEMEWQVFDATAMPSLDSGSFDVVLDKCLLDTFVCEDDEVALISAYFNEFTRVMADDGFGIFISFGPPEERLHWVPTKLLEVEIVEIPAKDNKLSGSHYAYVCRKVDPTKLCSPCGLDTSLPAPVAPAQRQFQGPDLSSRVVLCTEPLVVLVPSFLSASSCEALSKMCFSEGGSIAEGEDPIVMLDHKDLSWGDAERELIASVDAAIGELTGQPPHEEEPPLLPMVSRPALLPLPFPEGLHVDSNGGCPRRFAAAILYLTTPNGGRTAFPLALVPSTKTEILTNLPVTHGPSASADTVEAARSLVDSGVLHTRKAKVPPEQGLAEQLLKEAESGIGLAAVAQRGSLVAFWCRSDGGSVCPRSWHSGTGVGPDGEPKLILRKFKAMPDSVWSSGDEGVAAYVRSTRESHVSACDR